MSTGAVLMMILAMLVIWGGLAVAVINLNRANVPSVDEVRRDL